MIGPEYCRSVHPKAKFCHIVGHRRLGEGFTRCGQPRGERLVLEKYMWIRPCGTCQAEFDKDNPAPSPMPTFPREKWEEAASAQDLAAAADLADRMDRYPMGHENALLLRRLIERLK